MTNRSDTVVDQTLALVFGTQLHVLWWQECCRAALIFVFGLALVRAAGRRSFSKWSALDIIVSILVGSNLSRALTGNAPFWGTLAATMVLMALHALLAHGAARDALCSRLFEGRPRPIGSDGRLDRDAMKRNAVSEADLMEALRKSGISDLGQTKLLVLEPSGNITVLK